MANFVRNFIAGRMNKTLDERLIPDGEYIDALNIRLGSTEASEIGAVENSKGNTKLTTLTYVDGTPLSSSATCIGAYADGEKETMYWFVHDDAFTVGATGKLDLIVSYNTTTTILTYHIVSIDDKGGVDTTLNFNRKHLITGVNLIGDLLFFTDDLNQPRRINISKNYSNPVGNLDSFFETEILVVKAPPLTSPSINPINISGEENFLEDRIVCFAYRYKYEDNEYSAVSQFSAPTFVPQQYDLSSESYLNEGMLNSTNACQITFNSGGPLVVGVDVLFKEMSNDIIKVIEKINKGDEGYFDYTEYTITFTNSKIFTVLPSTEVLRLYDNVPLLAKAQTVMGNRLMYGNYVDGWDLDDANGFPTQFNYQTILQSKNVGLKEITYTRSSGNYTLDTSTTVPNSVLNLDLTTAVGTLNAGASIDLSLSFTHSSVGFGGNVTSYPIEVSTDRELNFLYTLPQTFGSVDELFNSVDFQEKIGTVSSILPVYSATGETSCDGLTLTDLFNCTIPASLQGGVPSPVYKYNSGITSTPQPIQLSHVAGSNIISFQFPSMHFVSDVLSPSLSVYEYYTVSVRNLIFSSLGSPTSLHSNRGYEIGMVYMDEFNRSTTALVSSNNTVHVGCSRSSNRNSIRVSIPPTQVAPYFATRYKFVIKADMAGYNTIYTSIFFYDTVTASNFFLLQGENAAKVEEGDRMIVKRDVDGPLGSCTYATVLEKKAQNENFITVEDSEGAAIQVPQGVYMQIRNSDFNTSLSDNAVLGPILDSVSFGATFYAQMVVRFSQGTSTPDASGVYPVFDIPTGSTIRLKFTFRRRGAGDGDNACERRIYRYDKSFTSSETYANIIEWWEGDNIAETLNSGDQDVLGNGCDVENEYVQPVVTVEPAAGDFYGLTPDLCTNYYRWFMDSVTNEIRLIITGTRACGNSDKKRARISSRIEVFRAENTIVFESEPSDTLPDVWYESSESYAIDSAGNHSGNVTNQNIASGVSGVVDTAFFNCFSFGNGVESYKVRDSMAGRPIVLGNRVTTVSAQDFKKADRFADMTYSGVFNSESNVNKLNEFNLGLLNFKTLEESFGPIEKMVAQQTNILVLQEDKISYVLASKNLISDSTGGGVVASVPEILGTQLARVEKFGISNNPESFAQWGPAKYFSDAKRGAVIQLTGDGPQESLSVISEAGMRSWFRDMFISNFSTQKLGGFDPYMNEYVLGNTTTLIPQPIICVPCGVSQDYDIGITPTNICSNAGAAVGTVTVSWIVNSLSDSFSFTATYAGTQTVYGPFTASGSQDIPKSLVSEEIIDISISTNTGVGNISMNVGCPTADSLTLILVTVTNDDDTGKQIHNQYRWSEVGFTSPTQSNQIQFSSSSYPLVISQYETFTGQQGSGMIPPDGTTVFLVSDKQSTDDYDLNVSEDRFAYLRTSTLYGNNPTDISSLLSAATSLTPVGTTPIFSNNFTMPSGSASDYLYLIWDYVSATEMTLCFSASSASDSCCACTCDSTGSICTEWLVDNTSSSQVVLQYTQCGSTKTSITLGAGSSTTLCASGNISIISGSATGVNFTITQCDCT